DSLLPVQILEAHIKSRADSRWNERLVDGRREQRDHWKGCPTRVQSTIQCIGVFLAARLAAQTRLRRDEQPGITLRGALDELRDLIPKSHAGLYVPAIQFDLETGGFE